jgi:hypothetical protein
MHRNNQGTENVDGIPIESLWAGKTINEQRAEMAKSPRNQGSRPQEKLIVFPASEIGDEGCDDRHVPAQS